MFGVQKNCPEFSIPREVREFQKVHVLNEDIMRDSTPLSIKRIKGMGGRRAISVADCYNDSIMCEN